MLPIIGADIYYPDGSIYRIPDDGTWAEAPPFGVQCVCYYHVDDLKTLSHGVDYYYWEGDFEGLYLKIGFYMDLKGLYRIVEKAKNGKWVFRP